MSRPGRFGCAVLVAACVGCATKSLPPGTPPPEYEKRTFEPWPPADAGVDAAGPDGAPSPDEAPLPEAGTTEPVSEPPAPL